MYCGMNGKKSRRNRVRLVKPNESFQSLLPLEARFKPTSPINVATNYSIDSEILRSFTSEPYGRYEDNFYASQRVWYGLNNMESLDGRFGVPHEMLTRLKPAEILALYIGIKQSKTLALVGEKFNERYEVMTQIPNSGFDHLIKWLMAIGYEHHAIKLIDKKVPEAQDVVSLSGRMLSISDASKDKFMESFSLMYRNPSPPDENYPYEFQDLGLTEKESPNRRAIKSYVTLIAGFIREMYIKNLELERKHASGRQV